MQFIEDILVLFYVLLIRLFVLQILW